MSRARRRDLEIIGRAKRRAAKLLASWPRSIAGDVRAPACGARRKDSRAPHRIPYWYLVPLWAAQQRRTSRAMLEDALFAQHCVVLTLRIQDDLFDRHRDPGPGVFAPTLLMPAAQQALGRWFPPDSVFWTEEQRLLTRSLGAVSRIASGQTRTSPLLRGFRTLYMDQDAALTIGLLAVCRGDVRSHLYRTLSRCAGHLAVAGQLLDDLEDMQADRAQGRTNAAVRFFGHAIPDAPRHRQLTLTITARAIERFLMLPKRELRAAERLLASLHLTPAHDYIEQSLAVIGRWEAILRRTGTLLQRSPSASKVKQ